MLGFQLESMSVGDGTRDCAAKQHFWGKGLESMDPSGTQHQLAKKPRTEAYILGNFWGIWEEKSSSTLRLVDLRFLLSYKVLPRCQDVGGHRLRSIQSYDFIMALSYRWKTPAHPDPKGEQLAMLYELVMSNDLDLESGLVVGRWYKTRSGSATFQDPVLSGASIGIFVDYTCLP
jgi:hypothetical protein